MIPIESSLAAIMETLAEGLIIIDAAGKPVHWNAATRRIMGGEINPEGRWINRAVVFEADETTPFEEGERPLMRALRGEEVTGLEIAVAVGDAFVHLATTTRALRDPSGVIVGAVGAFRDITESRRAERELHESVELYRTLANHLPQAAVVMFDRRQKVLFAGGGGLAVTGLGPAGEGLHANEVAGPQTLPIYLNALAGESSQIVVERAGRRFDVQVVPVRDKNGQVFAGLIVGQDTTVQSARLDELQKAKEQLRLTIENAPIGMAVSSLDGRFLQVNKALCEIVGYPAVELLGKTFQELTHPDDLAPNLALIAQLRDGTISRYKLAKRYLRKDGTIVNIMLHVSLLRDEQGHPVHAIAQVVDLTERKKLEEHLMVTDRMASIGTLAAGIAHEINNPLSYLMMNLDNLSDQIRKHAETTPSGPLREMLEVLTEARGGADRIRKIVRGMKAFSRPEVTDASPQDVRQSIDAAVALVENELRHRAQIVRTFDDVPSVDADEGRLTQVFINLLTNAAHAIPEGSAAKNQICLSTRTGEGGEAIIEVADTGAGIEPSILPRIFDPFFTTHALDAGTGLGLSISHGIISSFGGTLSVESVVGKGSVFRITLPRSRTAPPRAKAEAKTVEEASVLPAPRRRILVVDDDEMVGRALARGLTKEHDVTVVTSGTAAAEVLRRKAFDFVLCDLMMPEMTGMELHAAFAKSDPEVASRFVFMTGGAFTLASREYLDAVPNARFDKPVELKTLRGFLRGPLLPPPVTVA